MPLLSNDSIRNQSMAKFLQAININTNGVQISNYGGLFHFSFTQVEEKDINEFAKQLNETLDTKQAVKTLSLAKIIDNEIALATCNDEIHRETSRAIINIINKSNPDFRLCEQSGLLEITLPSHQYAVILNLLQYPTMKCSTDGKLIIDVNTHIKNMDQKILKFKGLNPSQSPLVYLKDEFLQKKKIFYSTKNLENNQVEVSPYFYVPDAPTPPTYHFVLDVSGSMESSIKELKDSVNKLAEELFEFQPKAKLTVTTFSSNIHELGCYEKQDLQKLKEKIDRLSHLNQTALYQVTAQFLEKLDASNHHNNILLFTDGYENGSPNNSRKNINGFLSKFQNTAHAVQNKFYIFSYQVTQDELMIKVANTFKSDIINTNSLDFLDARQNKEMMKKWASARELFKSRISIQQKNGGQVDKVYALPLEQSGQLVSLDPMICQPDDTIRINIHDSNDSILVASEKTLVPQQQKNNGRSNGKITLTSLSIHATKSPSVNQTPENTPKEITNLSNQYQ